MRAEADRLFALQLYNLGPGETLNNFSVHFKNRQHLANVEARVKAERGAGGGAVGEGIV